MRPPVSSTRTRLLAWTLVVTLPWPGCAGFLPPAESSPRFDLFAADEPMSTEAAPTAPPSEPAPEPFPASPTADVPSEEVSVTPAPASDSGPWIPRATEADDDASPPPEPADSRAVRARTATFWAGIGILSLGSAGLLAFGVTGRITQEQIRRGYDGSTTRDRDEQLQRRGDIMNGLAIGSAVVAIVGLGMATIAYAVDHSHCGPVSQRRWRKKECRR